MSKLDNVLDKAAFAFKDEPFCLDGTLNMQRDQLLTNITIASAAQGKPGTGDQRINTNPLGALKKELAELEEQMRDSTIYIRFTAVNNGLWQKWILQHPPRKGNTMDLNLGYNAAKFFEFAAHETGRFVEEYGVDGAEDVVADITPAQWVRIDEALTAGDWDRIDMTLITLNQREGSKGPDFLRNGSRKTESSEPTSDSPATSE